MIVCREKSKRGLRISDISSLNKGSDEENELEDETFWKKVIQVKYGEERVWFSYKDIESGFGNHLYGQDTGLGFVKPSVREGTESSFEVVDRRMRF